jgi:regulatory protein
MTPPSSDPLELAARALRHRDRSRHEIDGRLARAGGDDAARAEALETLERVGYLDDGRFASSRAAALAARGYGDEAIRADLEGQGVAPEPLAQALAALEPEAERAAALLARHGRDARGAARLTRKGFPAELVADLLGAEALPDDS